MNFDCRDMYDYYGLPVTRNEDGRVIAVNCQFFAELFRREYQPYYIAEEKRFYLWQPDSGLWLPQQEQYMLHLLGIFLHRCAEEFEIMELESRRQCGFLRGIQTFLSAIADHGNVFQQARAKMIHCRNGMLLFDREAGMWRREDFSPEHFSRNRCDLLYDPKAECPRFLNELLRPVMTEDDIELIQYYLGQCLLGENLSQCILILSGHGGSGKSTLVQIIEGIVGKPNCVQFRSEHMGSRFEMSRFIGRTLLTCKEIGSDFFDRKGTASLKELTGAELLNPELKGRNGVFDIRGSFNIIVFGNAVPRLRFDGDESAWRRRLRWVRYESVKPAKPILDFAQLLLQEEGSGILNWVMEGARKLLLANGQMPYRDGQRERIDYLVGCAEPLDMFVRNYVEPARNVTITVAELYGTFCNFCQAMEWNLWNEREF